MKHEAHSEQMEHIKALKESEEHYRKLISSLPAAVYTCNHLGTINYFNDVAVQLWGYKPDIQDDAVRFCACYKLFTPDGTFIPPHQTPMAIALETGQPFRNTEAIMERPDGTRFYASISIDPLLDEEGKITGAINVFHDISQWKMNEDMVRKNEELKKSEERYHKMVEEVEDYAILLMDKDGVIQNWNVGAEKIKGYTEKEIVGKHFRTFYMPADRESRLPEKLLNEAKQNGKAIHEGWRLRKDGTRFWGSIVITALHNDEDEIIGFSKVTRDLSERKYAEDRIRQYASELEFQNKELEEFAYAASHDLKEPLRKIHFYNSFILENCAAELNEKGRDYLDRSIAAVRRMRQLIEDILAYTKNSGSVAVYEDVDLSKLAEDIALHHKDELADGHVNIHIHKLPVVKGISFQLRQVLDNLVSNSIKYRHPDRDCNIDVSAELVRASQVPVGIPERSTRYYKISVKDNGTGFEQRYADKIFEIFQRLHGKTDTSGSGIGLAICKKIMQNHKGFIHATGSPGEGACFDFYLPA